MTHSVSTFLMFDGAAEQAMSLYLSLFSDSEPGEIERWGADEAGKTGTLKKAQFKLCGHDLICSDSPMKHDFTFTPSFSLFVECSSNEEFDHAFIHLSDQGQVLMPPDNYGFSKKFAWVSDRFDVSWQLNLSG